MNIKILKQYIENAKKKVNPYKINFKYINNQDYLLVQKQLSEAIQSHLKEIHYKVSYGYTNKCLNFTLFIRSKADVLMSHGVADKNYLWVKKINTDNSYTYYINNFKTVLVPGQWIKERMIKCNNIKLGPDQIIPVGWPRLDILRDLQKKIVKKLPNNKKTLLWAPTHDFRKRGPEEKSTSSYPDFEVYAKMLENKYNMLYSIHPRNRTNKTPTMDNLLNADIVISDFGTMVYEAWALGKPVIFPRWILGDRIIEYLKGTAEAYIFENRIGYHPDSYEEMIEIINSGPIIDQKVHDFMDEYLDNYRDGNSAKKIAGTLMRLSKNYV